MDKLQFTLELRQSARFQLGFVNATRFTAAMLMNTTFKLEI